MGLFDSYSEGSFKKLRDGRVAFYPHIVGRGYIVSEQKHRVLSRYTIRGLIIFLALMAFLSFFGAFFMFLTGSLFVAAYYVGLWWLTKDLERTSLDERLTLSIRYRTQAQHLGRTTLLLLELVNSLFILGGLYIITTRRDSCSLFLGLATVLFFDVCAWASAYMLRAKQNKPSMKSGD